MSCRSEHTRPGTSFVHDLVYPMPVCYFLTGYILALTCLESAAAKFSRS